MLLFPEQKIKEILARIKNIAIVGAKDKPGQPVDRVGRYLMDHGYNILPVHPARRTVWGIQAAPALSELETAPDVVVLFRAPQYCPDHAREVLALPRKPEVFWMQLGIASPEAARLMHEAGITVVQDLCISQEHERIFGVNGNER